MSGRYLKTRPWWLVHSPFSSHQLLGRALNLQNYDSVHHHEKPERGEKNEITHLRAKSVWKETDDFSYDSIDYVNLYLPNMNAVRAVAPVERLTLESSAKALTARRYALWIEFPASTRRCLSTSEDLGNLPPRKWAWWCSHSQRLLLQVFHDHKTYPIESTLLRKSRGWPQVHGQIAIHVCSSFTSVRPIASEATWANAGSRVSGRRFRNITGSSLYWFNVLKSELIDHQFFLKNSSPDFTLKIPTLSIRS